MIFYNVISYNLICYNMKFFQSPKDFYTMILYYKKNYVIQNFCDKKNICLVISKTWLTWHSKRNVYHISWGMTVEDKKCERDWYKNISWKIR